MAAIAVTLKTESADYLTIALEIDDMSILLDGYVSGYLYNTEYTVREDLLSEYFYGLSDNFDQELGEGASDLVRKQLKETFERNQKDYYGDEE